MIFEIILALPLTIIPMLCLIWLFRTITDLVRETRYLIREAKKQ